MLTYYHGALGSLGGANRAERHSGHDVGDELPGVKRQGH